MADYQHSGEAYPLGAPSPTPPPYVRPPLKFRLLRLLRLAAMMAGLGLLLFAYARSLPDGPSDAARIKSNCQFQYGADNAAVAACVAAKVKQGG